MTSSPDDLAGHAPEVAPDVSVADQRRAVLEWLRRNGCAEPVLHETHVSILAFTDDRVWKCKKAVRFPFVDLSTAPKRLANCEREVALNRRLAPDVYLGVTALTDRDGAVVDHLVEMRRLPDERRLSTIVEPHQGDEGGDRGECVEEIADVLVRFHGQAATGPEIDRSATPAALTESWSRNFEELRPFAGPVLDPALATVVDADARRFLAGRSVLFADRIAGKLIRDGHGDLLADDVFCLRDGPRVLDCLEFDDALRVGDVLADVAFLAMDLERLGRPDLGRRLLDRYRAGSQGAWPASLERYYLAYRACIRAKVACLRVEEDTRAAQSARDLLALAARHLEAGRVQLVLIGGAPASGKTTLANAFADLTGWPVVHSDEVRKDLAGIEATTSAAVAVDAGLYTASWGDRTYAVLLARARVLLERGSSVILDASWSAPVRRSAAEELATTTSSLLTAFLCEVAPEVADARALARSLRGTDASDASAAIAAELRARFVPWPDAVALDTSGPAEPLARAMAVSARARATPLG